MVKQGRLPGRGGMARGARSGNARLGVRRIVGPVVILRVAGVAIRGCALVLSAHVARDTVKPRVSSGERVAREFQVVELCAEPTVHRMTGLASRRKIQSGVTGIPRFLVIRQVAGRTLGRKSLVLPHRGAFVAELALDRGMSANQRETVLVLLDGG